MGWTKKKQIDTNLENEILEFGNEQMKLSWEWMNQPTNQPTNQQWYRMYFYTLIRIRTWVPWAVLVWDPGLPFEMGAISPITRCLLTLGTHPLVQLPKFSPNLLWEGAFHSLHYSNQLINLASISFFFFIPFFLSFSGSFWAHLVSFWEKFALYVEGKIKIKKNRHYFFLKF